jgi:hypothetical protein
MIKDGSGFGPYTTTDSKHIGHELYQLHGCNCDLDATRNEDWNLSLSRISLEL